MLLAGTVIDCTIITDSPRPMAVEIFLDTAMKVHMPRKNESARFSTKIAFTARESRASINAPRPTGS